MTGNLARSGGALTLNQDPESLNLASTELIDCVCSGNTATYGDGGCLRADSVPLRLQGGSYSDNASPRGIGGAVSELCLISPHLSLFGTCSRVLSLSLSLSLSPARVLAHPSPTCMTTLQIYSTFSDSPKAANSQGNMERRVRINSSSISDNTAATSGCVYVDQASCMILQNTTIKNCHATSSSGGMDFQFAANAFGCSDQEVPSLLPSSLQPVSLVVFNSTFFNNSGSSAGGLTLRLNSGAAAFMQRLVMRANHASQTDGGGMSVQGTQSLGTGTIHLLESTFISNTAHLGNGGAVYLVNALEAEEVRLSNEMGLDLEAFN
jgi:hypothetical protein